MTDDHTPALQAVQLTLREKIAQLVMVRIGSNLPPICTVQDDLERVERRLETCPVGGLLLFNGGTGAKAVLERLQRKSRVPLLVGSDIERGVGQQVQGCTLFPHQMAFEKLGNKILPLPLGEGRGEGAADSKSPSPYPLPKGEGNFGSGAIEAVAAYAKVLAAEARDVGIHITFAPVADVNTNAKNPIIATRAFSEVCERAAELTRAYVTSAEAAGLCTTAKHFPGHGSTFQDSHDSLPTVTRSRAELDACELPPFQAAIDAGCSLIMTAHVAYPALDPSGTPATLSRPILQGLLRDEMGFQGVVCSDSLLMAGVRHRYETEEELALATIMAGVDLLLDVEKPVEVIDYLLACVDRGTLPVERVDEAFARAWELKRRVFAGVDHVRPTANRNDAAAAALAERIARGAIERIGNRSTVLPFKRDVPLTAILLKPFETPLDPPEQPLAPALRERFRDVQYVQLGPQADAAAYDAARRLAANAQQLLIAVIVRPAAWHAFGLRTEQEQLVRELTHRGPVVLASLGVPYVLRDHAAAAYHICTYSDVPISQQVLAAFLLGQEWAH